ncbi:hypothetical protein R1sor_016198 [Riccia sorocarpa]|uniref:SWIM-type domain-containing protein n=1 Tax=Riccia sorocarpa TaxID=122646 RepID=A0ABD3HIC0_9MARC
MEALASWEGSGNPRLCFKKWVDDVVRPEIEAGSGLYWELRTWGHSAYCPNEFGATMRCVSRQNRVCVNRPHSVGNRRTSEKRRAIERFRCQGELRITLDTSTAMCSVTCIHLEDHERPSWRDSKFPREALEFLDRVVEAGMRTANVYCLLRLQDHIDPAHITRAHVNYWVAEIESWRLVYLLAKKVVGDVEISLNQFQKGREFPTWWVKFRRQWVKLAEREPAARGYYATDVSAWTCSCPAFVSAKYLICKHLVLGYTTGVSAKVHVYLQTYRRFDPPFYVFQSSENFFSRQTMEPKSDPWYEQPAYVEHGMPEDIGIGGIDSNEDPIEMIPADDPETKDGGADENVAAIAGLLAEMKVSGDDNSAGEAAPRGKDIHR